MAITDYHAMVLGHQLTGRSASKGVDKLAGTLAGAQVHLNPHQIDAALFAFQNPLSQGVLLADEVGLGKTIEAGLVISQLWAERERSILVITPATLRKQWYSELDEKFFLPCTILEAKSYNQLRRSGDKDPFDSNNIVICSYQFAKAKAADLQQIPWDLVVMDEAHFLRNVYKSSGSTTAKAIKTALAGRRKLLLTATPLQNTLTELFGLVSMIDENVFGDLKSFNDQYARLSKEGSYEDLKQRLKPIAQRTLRRQVTAYVRYTDRKPLVQRFEPDQDEHELYNLVSEYLRRDNLKALPASQRSLMTLVLRKLLASSTFAIAATLEGMANRLRRDLSGSGDDEALIDTIGRDYEALADVIDDEGTEPVTKDSLSAMQQQAIRAEIRDLDAFASLAKGIRRNAKGDALLKALDIAFDEAERLGAPRKAIVFTESRRTQDYLLDLLQSTEEHAEGVLLFNGSNTDPRSREIYADWAKDHQGGDRVTGSRTADMRSALVDYFAAEGQIMIATEAAAQGLNLQFCSLIINYDLPWNPQRIEQRIGRCHRYGQKHDVVVVNFLNVKNEADERVYELLNEKFKLFEGVFGASDEVLGAIGSGYDIERQIADIYQNCRKSEEIDFAFRQLRLQLDEEIREQMSSTRKRLLEHFDEDVTARLQSMEDDSKKHLDRIERSLMQLTRHELGDTARFSGDDAFILWSHPDGRSDIPVGRYELPRRNPDAHIYRIGHPLAENLIERAKARMLRVASVVFDYTAYEGKISTLAQLEGRSGWLAVSSLSLEGKDLAEDHLLVAAVTDAGDPVPATDALRFFSLPAHVADGETAMPFAIGRQLHERHSRVRDETITDALDRNAAYLDEEAEKLDKWADDLRQSIRSQIKDLDTEVELAKRAIKLTGSGSDRLAARRQVNQLEAQRDEKEADSRRQTREITERREELYTAVEERLKQDNTEVPLFTIRWNII